MTNIRSAMLSMSSPLLLVAWSLRAKKPSNMSEMPAQTYNIQKYVPKTGHSNNRIAAMPRVIDKIFGIDFISVLPSHDVW